MKMQSWYVYVLNSQGKRVKFRVPFVERTITEDIVFFDNDMSADVVKKSLIDHDGYPYNISVARWK